MCFITFREHFSFKKKKQQNKAKQKYSSGESSLRQRVKYVFEVFLWVGGDSGVRRDALCNSGWAGGEFLRGYQMHLALVSPPAQISFSFPGPSFLSLSVSSSPFASSLSLCLTSFLPLLRESQEE